MMANVRLFSLFVCIQVFQITALVRPFPNQFRIRIKDQSRKFSPSSNIVTVGKPTSTKLYTPTALRFKVIEGEDEITDSKELEFDTTSADVSNMLKKISAGMIPLAASIGFAVTPSSSIAARVAGAAIGGVAGFVLKRTVSKPTESDVDDDGNNGRAGGIAITSEVETALELLESGPPVDTLTLKRLEKVAKQARIPLDSLPELFTHVFANVVYNAITHDSTDFTELSDITDFAQSMKLSPAEIADGFTLALSRLGQTATKDEQGFFADDSKHLLLYAARSLFIGSKLITSNGFYGKRFAVALSLFPPEEYAELITESCTKLFRRAVESVILKPQSFTKDEIDKLREFLTIDPNVSSFRPANMESMIMEALQFTLDMKLKSEDVTCMDAKIDNYADLEQAQEVLGWNLREFKETIEVRTMPVFEKAARKIINEVVEEPGRADEFAAIMQERVASLNIDVSKAKQLLITIVSDKNYEYMDLVDRVYNSSAGAVEPAFKIMVSYTSQHNAMKKVLESIMGDTDIPVPGLPFAEIIRASMYKLQLEGGEAVNSDLFALNEEQKKIVRKNLALPKVSNWISQCILENNFNEGAKSAYEKLLVTNEVSAEQWKATSVDFYYQEAKKVSESRAVPSEDDMQRLLSIANFLNCPQESVEKVTLELFGDKYVKALSESMMPTGVITTEYLDGLDRLRNRLRLSETDAAKLLGVAIRQRTVPIVKDLVDQWKIAIGVSKRKEDSNIKDKSGDPIADQDNVLGYMETGSQKEGGGPNVFMREALNLIDFIVGNYAVQGLDLEASLSSTSTVLPVTAVGIVPEADLSSMFKHYLITRLTEQDSNLKARYIENERLFALILGIHPDDQIRIIESLAYTAYKNMLKNVFRAKEEVEPQDLKQFALLRESLGLNETTAEMILKDASRSAVLENAANLFLQNKAKTQAIQADTIQRFRRQVQSLGLSMKNDAGFNEKLLAYLFSVEVQYLIENGMESEIQELQESYEIPIERAEPVIAAACQRYVSQLLSLALRSARKYKEVESVGWVREILKYSVYFEGTVDADGMMFSEEDKERLISFYETDVNLDTMGLNSPEHDNVVRLRNMINLREDFTPPAHGIDGLLVSDSKALAAAAMGGDLGDMKKRWAWN
eukprot:gene7394-15092_t